MSTSRPGSAAFTFWNEKDPAPRPFLTIAGRILPGIARVQADVAPFAARWRERTAAAVAGDAPLWVALGDSMTLGVGASAYDRGWVGQLAARLVGHGYRLDVVNLGVSGARTADVLDRQLPALAELTATVRAPALVTLMIGANDLLRRGHRDELPARFAEILQRLPAGSVVTTLPQPRAAARAADVLLERAARNRSLIVAELRDRRLESWRGRLAPDHFHPNDAGYAVMADVVEPAVLRAL